MNEGFPAADVERVREAGLSATLIEHASSGQPFLGFLSYRRGDALPLARWLRDRITSFKAPAELRDKIGALDASVGGSQNRVFLDMSYQKPNVDFWDEHIAASLCRSRTLLLLQTPSVFERLDNGEPNWCEREIETFLKYYGDPSRVLVVMGPGAPIDRFPAPLERISARWDWVDLRFFSESALTRFRMGGQYDPQVAKVLAKIFDIEDGDLPILNREFVKARARVRRNLAVAASAAIVGLSGLTTWALIERSRAAAAERVAIQQRDEAVRQRNAALISQSRYLSQAADGLVKDGTTRGAVAILREALPDPATGRDRPLVHDAIASAYKAIYENRERGRLEMPQGAAAIATDGAAGRIVIATPDALFVREGLTAEGQKILPHDFGAPAKLVLSPDRDHLAMIGRDGTVAVRSLQSNAVVARHGGEGAGTRVAFIQSGKRLLLTDDKQMNWHLIDVASGEEIASRALNGKNGKAIVSLIDADADVLAFIDDEQLVRVSLDDLNDLATFKIENADEYAMTLSPDKTVIYLAAAKVILDGRMMVLDSHTLALQRTFGRISWGAIMLAASPRFNMLALHGRSGIDFYDIKEGDRLYHVSTSFPVVGGRFLGGSTDSEYMAYGSDGSIRRWTPELGTETGAYMTIDGGSIQRLDKLPDGGFLSISDRPSITNWAFDTRGVSKEYSTPLIIRGDNMGFPRPLSAFDFSAKQNAVIAAYSGNLVQRWNLDDGTMTVVKTVEPSATDSIEKVTSLANGITVTSRASGVVESYSASAGPDRAVGTIKSEPLAYLAPIADTQAFFVDKSGRAGRIDVADAAAPRIEMLPVLAQCAGEASTSGFAVCVDKDGKTRVLRNADGKLLTDLPPPAGGLASAFMSDDGTRLAVGGWAGDIDIRALPEDKSVKKMTLSTNLSGRRLLTAVQSGKMSATDLAAIRGGASKLDVTLGANTVALSEDQVYFAAGMPYGVLKVFNLEKGTSRDFLPNAANAFIEQMAFSPHGRLIAAMERSEYRVLAIYDVEDGSRLARISLSNQAAPKLFALTNGRGFVTIDTGGRIIVHPVFEKTDDFIAYLSKEFPQPLTPAQKRAFFID